MIRASDDEIRDLTAVGINNLDGIGEQKHRKVPVSC
jgi:hypothetical protein